MKMNEMSDAAFLTRPELWPAQLAVPVRRKDATVGTVLRGQGPVVFMINIWKMAHEGKSIQDVLDDDQIGRFKYFSFTELIDDGWYVD